VDVGESRSEQNEPLRDESEEPEELRLAVVVVRPPAELDTLKKLLSWATALFMSACTVSGKFQALLPPPAGPPNMGSCLTGVTPFFSGVVGAGRSSSSAWIKWHRGP